MFSSNPSASITHRIQTNVDEDKKIDMNGWKEGWNIWTDRQTDR
jgi:hypothetical protein